MSGLARSLAAVGRFWRGVVGADAYEVYVDHLRRHHPDVEPMEAKAFWKAKWEDQERHPRARCC